MIDRLGEGEKVPFVRHLDELRKRLLICVAALAAAFIGCYAVSDKLLKPFADLLGAKMVFLTPMEAFMAYMSIAFYAAVAITVPVIAWQAWAFIAPGLKTNERRFAAPMVLAASGLFFTGAAFCWFIVLPFAVKFLMSYGGDIMTPMISVKAYLNFCLSFLLVFGIIFELPLVVIFINAIGLVSLEALRSFRRYWVVAAFVIGAIVTPTPDVVNQTLTSVPLIVLYEISLVYLHLFGRKQ
ncbi:MAG: twin-arginine translocase subunit TatC [Nitrospinae bacterium]|nr:twin-arginine translocase subunit TatC [Nitrospinota bacterium]